MVTTARDSEGRESKTNVLLGVTNTVLLGLTITIASVFIYFEHIYKPEVDLEQSAKYLEVAKERLENHSDAIMKEAGALAEETLVPIGSAIDAQAREDYPRFLRALKLEGRTYVSNVEANLVKQLRDRYGEYVREHRDLIREEFPEYGSDEKIEQIVKDFQRTADRLLERYYLDEFRRETDRTIALWDRVQPISMPEPSEPSLQEQLAEYAADWTVLAVAEPAEDAAVNNHPKE